MQIELILLYDMLHKYIEESLANKQKRTFIKINPYKTQFFPFK